MAFLIGVASLIIICVFLLAMFFGFREEINKNGGQNEKIPDEFLEDFAARLAPMLKREMASTTQESDGRSFQKPKNSSNQSNIYNLTDRISERKNVRNR